MTQPQPASTTGGSDARALTGVEIAALTGGRLVVEATAPIRGAAVDSRRVAPGMLFVALPGERTDGHRFLGDAMRAGAAGLLVSRLPDDLAVVDGVSVILVPETLPALGQIAASWRSRFDPLVVGVTGSVAKTSTKEACAAVLARRFRTLKTPGNENNEIGLPLTLLQLGPEHEAAVLEMGMYQGGEIATLAVMSRPRIGVVTVVREVHLSRAGSMEAIENAKAELVEALPADGTAVLNADDPRVRRMAARTRARVILYGFADDAGVTARDVTAHGADGMTFSLHADDWSLPARIPVLGRHSVHNALAAAATGLAAGLDADHVVAGLADGWSAAHRGQLIRAGDVTVIDDAYNASPMSVLAALDVLAHLPGRHVAVLGEMLELGTATDAGHLRVGEAAAAVDHLVVVGPGAALIAEGALAAGMAPARLHRVGDRTEALALLRDLLAPGDVVLVKASRGAALEELVETLVAEMGARGGPR